MSQKALSKRQSLPLSLMLRNLVHQEGDCGAELLSLVEHYIEQCCRTYYSISYSDRQDIAQEASIKLLVHYEAIKDVISKRWVYIMVKNLCIDTLRAQRAKQQGRGYKKDEDSLDWVPPTAEETTSSQFDNYECLDNAFGYIANQPKGQEDLIIYTHFAYGLSRADIAFMTGRTVSAVTKRISILRARLKELRHELC